MKRQFRIFVVAAILSGSLLAARHAAANVSLPALIGDNMVLQQGIAARIWGTADPGEMVTVRIAQQEHATRAGSKGRWQVWLHPMRAGGPFEMTVSGKNLIKVRNVLVGEVWVCSGQSNMVWPVRYSVNPQHEISEARYPGIRLFSVAMNAAPEPQRDVKGKWVECGPQTVGGFSAVAYFFGRELHKALRAPIGLINSSVGGTPAEAWTSLSDLTADPDFGQIVARLSSGPARLSFITPTYLYNGMIAPLAPYAIRGVIWYQGESNVGRAREYRKLFPAMIRNWRRAWRQGDFPFLFVQLANILEVQKQPDLPSGWAELREAQTMSLSVPDTAMVVIIDIGDAVDIHPRNKQEVGWRLAQAALGTVYGRSVVYSGPIYDGMEIEGNRICLHFKHVGGGLTPNWMGKLRGFAIAGEDRHFVWADAKVEGESVVVSSDQVAKPVAVRYGWAENPIGNLYNKAGFPASPFRTDDWPAPTAAKQ